MVRFLSMKDIILHIDEKGNLVDDNNLLIYASFEASNFAFKNASLNTNIEKLVALGLSANDLVQLKTLDII